VNIKNKEELCSLMIDRNVYRMIKLHRNSIVYPHDYDNFGYSS
jgi:hypothetical protein